MLLDANFWIGAAVTAVVFGVPVGFLVSYSSPRLERWWSTRSEAKRAQRSRTVESLSADPEGQMYYLALENRWRHRCTLNFVMCVAMGMLTLNFEATKKGPEWLGMALLAMVFVMGYQTVRAMWKAIAMGSLVQDARRMHLYQVHGTVRGTIKGSSVGPLGVPPPPPSEGS